MSEDEKLEPLGDIVVVPPDQVVAYSIAVSLKRIADDIHEIKNGMRFICERWSSK